MSNAMDIQAPTWDLSQIFSGFDGTDYQQALADYTAGMDDLDKRLADVSAQQSDFSRWLADYLVKSNKTGALEESLNAFAYAMYSTDTTNSEYLNNVSKLEELGLQSTAQNLVFQGILPNYSPDLSTF